MVFNRNSGFRMISIHAPREGGDATWAIMSPTPSRISIHAPREGGDCKRVLIDMLARISIHAPREGGDTVTCAPDSVVS